MEKWSPIPSCSSVENNDSSLQYFSDQIAAASIAAEDIGMTESSFRSLLQAKGGDSNHLIMTCALLEQVLRGALRKKITIIDSSPKEESEFLDVLLLNIGFSGSSGLLEMSKKIGLLSKRQATGIECLIQLRNQYAHDITKTHMNVAELIESLPSRKRESLRGKLAFEGYGMEEPWKNQPVIRAILLTLPFVIIRHVTHHLQEQSQE